MITWSEELEAYFATAGEKAHCFSWMHKRSEEIYSLRRTYIDLPVIILSSLTGFCTAGSETFFRGNTTLASVVLGISSLFVGMLNTTGSYFGWAKRSEGHRLSSIHYAKLFRQISVEMRLPRDERVRARDFLKIVRDQYDRLSETSPLVPRIVIRAFRQKFSKSKYDMISKPEEVNGLERIHIIASDTRFPTSSPFIRIPRKTQSQTDMGGNISSDSSETKFNVMNPMRQQRAVTIISPTSMQSLFTKGTRYDDPDKESSGSIGEEISPARETVSSVRVETQSPS